MGARNLDLAIIRKGRTLDTISVFADPADIPALEAELRGWLEANGWHAGRWGEFELAARYAGEGKVRAKVRA